MTMSLRELFIRCTWPDLLVVTVCIMTVLIYAAKSVSRLSRISLSRILSEPEKSRNVRCTAVVLLMAMAVIGAATFRIETYSAAILRGMYDPATPFWEMREKIPVTPVQSRLPDDRSGKLIIYFRFGCGDCEAVYPELSERLDGQEVYYISTRSVKGRELLDAYPVPETPSALYVYPDGNGYATVQLYKPGEDGNPELDLENLEYILGLKTQLELEQKKSGMTHGHAGKKYGIMKT